MSAISGYAARYFFDRKKLDGRLTKAKRTALIRTGAFTRTIARRSIKKSRRGFTKASRKRYEAEKARRRVRGMEPPPVHWFKRPIPSKPGEPPRDKNGHLKRTILFGYDSIRESVAVGAIPFGPNKARFLEHGGRTRQRGYRGRQFSMNYLSRPFMRPAQNAAKPKVKEFFRKIL